LVSSMWIRHKACTVRPKWRPWWTRGSVMELNSCQHRHIHSHHDLRSLSWPQVKRTLMKGDRLRSLPNRASQTDFPVTGSTHSDVFNKHKLRMKVCLAPESPSLCLHSVNTVQLNGSTTTFAAWTNRSPLICLWS
jgi:hypothetical protein